MGHVASTVLVPLFNKSAHRVMLKLQLQRLFHALAARQRVHLFDQPAAGSDQDDHVADDIKSQSLPVHLSW